jgi:hypothetical protein
MGQKTRKGLLHLADPKLIKCKIKKESIKLVKSNRKEDIIESIKSFIKEDDIKKIRVRVKKPGRGCYTRLILRGRGR